MRVSLHVNDRVDRRDARQYPAGIAARRRAAQRHAGRHASVAVGVGVGSDTKTTRCVRPPTIYSCQRFSSPYIMTNPMNPAL